MDGTVLVTGGRGYLGSLVVARLVAAGVPTISLDMRPPVRGEHGLGDLEAAGSGAVGMAGASAAEETTADLRSVDLVGLCRDRGVKAVVHLAAILEPPKGMNEADLEELEVGVTARVIQACVEADVEHLTVMSSGAAYGYRPRNDGHLLTEDESTPGSTEFAYSRNKAKVEALAHAARRLHPSLGVLVLRPGTILGARTSNQITALFTKPVIMTLRGTDSPFVFIWDEDVAEVVVEGVMRRRRGTYNLAGDGVMTMRDIADAQGARLVRLPAGLVRRALTVGRRLGVGRYGPEQVQFLLHRPVLDNTRLRRDFPGLPRKSSREAYEVFRQGRHG